MINIKRISIIALILLVIGGVGVFFTFKSASQAEDWSTKEETINSKAVMNIKVETDNIEIEILSTEDEAIKVELTSNQSQSDLITDLDGDTLSIQAKQKRLKLFSFDLFSFGSTLTVYVPEKAFNSFLVESNNGRITVSQIEVDQIHTATDNGIINLNNLKSSLVEAKTSNGKIDLDHVEGEVIGKTSNGSITLNTEYMDHPINLETNNGKIDVHTENEPTNVTFDVRVDNGLIRIFGDSNWDTVIGNGDHVVKLVTNNGKITVTK